MNIWVCFERKKERKEQNLLGLVLVGLVTGMGRLRWFGYLDHKAYAYCIRHCVVMEDDGIREEVTETWLVGWCQRGYDRFWSVARWCTSLGKMQKLKSRWKLANSGSPERRPLIRCVWFALCYILNSICVEEIHSVGTINNVETSYFTQLKICYIPNDNVSVSIGHVDHVLLVYSSIEHVTWKSPGPMCGWRSRLLPLHQLIANQNFGSGMWTIFWNW